MATMNVSLPDDMKAHVDAQVRAGQFANASDYIRSLIRYDQRELDMLRAAIAEGDASGVVEDGIDDIIEAAFTEPLSDCD